MTKLSEKIQITQTELDKLAKNIGEHFQTSQNHLRELRLENEILADRFIEATMDFLKMRKHYEEQFDQFDKNQKILQKQIRDQNTMLSFKWKAEKLDIDTDCDFIKFTSKDSVKYLDDYTMELDQKQYESGKKVHILKLKKKRPKKKKEDKQLSFDFGKEDQND